MINTELGPYRTEVELGRGGMATVYKAFHQPLRRYVALKILDPLLSRNPEFQRRFEQEATIAAQLDHPNIVAVYDLGVAGGQQYIAMRLIEGPTLERVIAEGGPMRASRALSLVAQLADALNYAHEAGVLHRDVKPSNVMLRRGDQPIITDFGIARAAEGLRLTLTQGVVGTPRYMSPEQAMAQPLDGRSDLYSLGIVLYEMLAGQPPFQANSTPSLLYKHVHEAPTPLRELRPDLTVELEALLNRCLAKSPEDRPQSGEELAGACRALLASLRADDTTVELAAVRPAPLSESPRQRLPAVPSARVPDEPSPARSTPVPSTPGPPEDPRLPTVLSGPPQAVDGGPPIAPRPLAAAPPGASPSSEREDRPTADVRIAERASVSARPRAAAMAWLGAFGLLLLLGVAMVTLLNSRPGEPGPATPPVRQAQVVVATASPAGAPIIPIPTPAERPAPPAAPANVQPTPAPATPTPPLPTVTPVPEPVRRLTDGQTALARRDWPSAVEQFDKGLALEPANRDLAAGAVQARLGLGDQLWNQGALNEALSQFRAVLAPPLEAASNDQARRQATLARHYLQGEIGWDPDLQAAVGEFQQVYDLEPGYRAARDKLYSGRVILANRLLEGGDRDAAIAQLVAARDLDPDRAEARELLVSLTPTPVPPPPAPPQAPAQPAPQPARPAPAPQPAQPAPQPAQPAPQPAPTPAKQFVPPTPPPAPR